MALLGIDDPTRILNLGIAILWAITIVLREYKRRGHVIFVKEVEHVISPRHPVTLFICTLPEQQYSYNIVERITSSKEACKKGEYRSALFLVYRIKPRFPKSSLRTFCILSTSLVERCAALRNNMLISGVSSRALFSY
jgi:hypothetical protein